MNKTPFLQRGFLLRTAYDRARRDAELTKLNRHLVLYLNEDSDIQEGCFLGPVDEECFLVDGTYVDDETYRKRKNAFLERKSKKEAELREDFLKAAYMASEYTADWGVTDKEEHKMQATYNVDALKAKLEELIAEEEARRNEKAEWIRDEIAERLQRAIEEKQDVTARTVANDVEEAADEKFARKAGRIGTMRKSLEKLSLIDGDTVTLDDTDLYNLGLEHH